MCRRNLALAFLASLLVIMGIYLVYTFLPAIVRARGGDPALIGDDWIHAFQPAALRMLAGESPYEVSTYMNPPWVAAVLIPFAFLPPALGSAVMFVLNVVFLIVAAVKMKMNPVAFALFLALSGVAGNSVNGNIEGLFSIGFILNPVWGLFFVLAKPQFGIGVALFWGATSLLDRGLWATVRTFLPAAGAFLLSFIIYGFWFRNSNPLGDAWWNASIFPYGVPFGVLFLSLGVWKRDIRWAIMASPFFAPYLNPNTWSVVWFGLLLFVPQRVDVRRLTSFLEAKDAPA